MHQNTTSDTIRKRNPLQRVFTFQLTLNREHKASEAQLSPNRFNLTLGTHHSINLKLKMEHHESVKFSNIHD